MQSLKQICFEIWNDNITRQGIKTEFKPVFLRYIGIDNNNEYNDVLATFIDKVNANKDISILFENEIPFPQNFNLMSAVSEALNTIDVSHFKDNDVVIFQDATLNHIFTEALNNVLSIVLVKENFANISMRNSFITKLIMWAYEYMKNIKFNTNKNPKCIYYGNISHHEIYFLLLLYRMTFDVIYINPLKDGDFEMLDTDHLSTLVSSSFIMPVDTLANRTVNAKVLTYDESYLYQMQTQIDNTLYGNGVYKPWQLRNYTPFAITKQSTLIDLEQNINEPAKVRDGFSVNEKTVHIPCFFMKIDGIYKDQEVYNQLIAKCISNNISEIFTTQDFVMPWKNEDMYSLAFTQLSNGMFDIEEIKKLSFYTYSKYKTEIQNLLLNKINETISSDILHIEQTKENILRYAMMLLNLNERLIRLIDNFDFANDIVKVIVFLENNQTLTNDTMMVLAFLHTIGIDILIFDPSGMTNTDIIISSNILSNIRLDYMKYDLTFADTKKKQKKGFWKKLFD